MKKLAIAVILALVAQGAGAEVTHQNCAIASGNDFSWSGACVNGYAEGQGELKVFDKGELYSTYMGQLKAGQRQGQGTMTWADGDKYEGQYQNGKRHGKGTYTYADGHKYEGQWQDDEYHGQGIMTYPDGDKYEGQYQNGKRHGKGTYTYASGRKDKCQWVNGEKSTCSLF